MRSFWSRWSKALPLWFLSSLVDACFVQLWSMLFLLPWRDEMWRAALPSLGWLVFVGCAGDYLTWRYGRAKAVRRSTQLVWGLVLIGAGYLITHVTWRQAGGHAGWLEWNPAVVAAGATLAVWLLHTARLDRSAAAAVELRTKYAWSLGLFLFLLWGVSMSGANAGQVPGLLHQLGVVVFVGFVASLVEFGLLMHRENVERLHRSGEQDLNHPAWATPVAVLVGGLAIALGEVFPSGGAGPIVWLVRNVAFILIYPFAWVGGYVAQWLSTWLRRHSQPKDPRAMLEQAVKQIEKGKQDLPPLDQVGFPLWAKVGLVVLVIGVVVGLLILVRTRRDGEDVEGAEQRESLGVWSRLWRDLRGTRNPGDAGEPLPPARTETARLYRRLQRWAAQRGLPRQWGQTPGSHAQTLAQQHPADAGAIDSVVALYERERYSQAAPGEPDVAAAAAAMQRLDTTPPSGR